MANEHAENLREIAPTLDLIRALATTYAARHIEWLETELAKAKAKVAKGERFREWLETRWGSELFGGLVGSWEAEDAANNPSK